MSSNKPLVSVCMTAYNQADFLVDAIEGVLMQQTNFKFELLIGEDNSPKDNTLELCLKYQEQYPDIIKVMHDGKNHGMVGNTQRIMDAAQGKYIAFCEADDYWIDPLKLQKQVDVLEANPQYVACACQSRIIYGTNKLDYQLLNQVEKENRVFTLADILTKYSFQTSSFIFKTAIIQAAPPIPKEINGLDRIQYFLLASFGDIYWLKDDMAVYRKNADGSSFNVDVKKLEGDLSMVSWLRGINKNIPLNALKAHIYSGIISIANTISLLDLLKYGFLALKYEKKAEFSNKEFKKVIVDTLEFRLPRNLRRVFRKIGVFAL